MTGSSPATRPASRWCSTPSGGARQRAADRMSRPVSSATRRCPTAGAPCRCFSCSPSAISTRATRPRRSPRPAASRPRRIRRLAAEIARVAFEQEIEIAVAVDRLGRPAPRDDARPAGLDPCDARHLGPFQRLPDLPRAASAADPARHDRCAGRLALQVAVSEAGPAGPEAGRQARPGRRRQTARRRAARLSDGARRICSSTTTAGRCASTRRSPGTRRSPRTA